MKFAAHRSNRRRRSGFTLVELAIVVAIIGVMAALAVPRFAQASDRYRARLAADRIARDIAHTRARAMSLGASQTISFSEAQASYTIVGMNNPDGTGSYTVLLNAPPYHCARVKPDFAGADSLTFNGYGVASSAGTVTVKSASTTCIVTVGAGAGLATVTGVQ